MAVTRNWKKRWKSCTLNHNDSWVLTFLAFIRAILE